MSDLPGWLREVLDAKEDERLEFKEARSSFDFEKLAKYCAALANERGGRLILGVTNKRPRQIAGSRAFSGQSLDRAKLGLLDSLRLRVEAEEAHTAKGRVVMFSVPSRPIGVPIRFQDAYWMRVGESVVAMTPDHLKRIFAESGPDFSAEICAAASLDDLEPAAIEDFRRRWIAKSRSEELSHLAPAQLLADAELLVGDRVTFAALILFGSRGALGRHLADAEVVYEYRPNEAAGPAQQRVDYRRGFFTFHKDLWDNVNAPGRN